MLQYVFMCLYPLFHQEQYNVVFFVQVAMKLKYTSLIIKDCKEVQFHDTV